MPRKPKPDTRSKPTITDIEAMKAQGMTQTQIAEHFGVSRARISQIKQEFGGKLSPREEANRANFPWKLTYNLGLTPPIRRLRDHGEYMKTRGEGMDRVQLVRLRNWYLKLQEENIVLEYDPNIPRGEGEFRFGCLAYRQRTPKDEDYLIRVNEYTTITDEGDSIWRFPPEMPQV